MKILSYDIVGSPGFYGARLLFDKSDIRKRKIKSIFDF